MEYQIQDIMGIMTQRKSAFMELSRASHLKLVQGGLMMKLMG